MAHMRKIIGIAGSAVTTTALDGTNTEQLELFLAPDGTVRGLTPEQIEVLTKRETERNGK